MIEKRRRRKGRRFGSDEQSASSFVAGHGADNKQVVDWCGGGVGASSGARDVGVYEVPPAGGSGDDDDEEMSALALTTGACGWLRRAKSWLRMAGESWVRGVFGANGWERARGGRVRPER